MRYPYSCGDCESNFFRTASIKDGPPESPTCTCGSSNVERVWVSPQILHKGDLDRSLEDWMRNKTFLKKAHVDQIYKKGGEQVQAGKRLARKAKQARKSERRKDGEFRRLAAVPPQIHNAAKLWSKDPKYWENGGKEALKRHGVYCEE